MESSLEAPPTKRSRRDGTKISGSVIGPVDSGAASRSLAERLGPPTERAASHLRERVGRPPCDAGWSAEENDFQNAILARFSGSEGLIAVQLPSDATVFTISVTRKEHLSASSVGYGLLEPKAKDILKVRLSNKENEGEAIEANQRYAIKKLQLFQLQERTQDEWLKFIDALTPRLNATGCSSSIGDLGNLEIVWAELLSIHFDAPLSCALCKFLLALKDRHRWHPLHGWESAYDWLLNRLIQPDCLSRLMKPLFRSSPRDAAMLKQQILELYRVRQKELEPLSKRVRRTQHAPFEHSTHGGSSSSSVFKRLSCRRHESPPRSPRDTSTKIPDSAQYSASSSSGLKSRQRSSQSKRAPLPTSSLAARMRTRLSDSSKRLQRNQPSSRKGASSLSSAKSLQTSQPDRKRKKFGPPMGRRGGLELTSRRPPVAITNAMANLTAWTSEGSGEITIVDPPHTSVSVKVSRKDLVAEPEVGYGLIEPKVQDLLKVSLVRNNVEDSDESADDIDNWISYRIEKIHLWQLSRRRPDEWLALLEKMRCHLEDAGCSASVRDLGNLEIVWGRLLNVDFASEINYSAALSTAIGRFLLAMRRRCRRFHRCAWDSAYDWFLNLLMQPVRLGRLMRPLITEALCGTAINEKVYTHDAKSIGKTGTRTLSEEIQAAQTASAAEISQADQSEPTLGPEDTPSVEQTHTKNQLANQLKSETQDECKAEAAHKLFCELARLMCTRDASLMDRALLPMARELAIATDFANPRCESRCRLLLLEMLNIIVEVQRSQLASNKTVSGILPSHAELSAETSSSSEAWLTGLRPALETGAYNSTEDYIDSMLQLLRADCFDNFHECMQQVKSGRPAKDVGLRLYLNAKVVAVKVATRGATLRIGVTFDLPSGDKGPSNWSKSSRLMQGNLLCLSLDEKFSQHFWATVVEKRQEELTANNRLVWIQPCRPDGSGVSVGEALVDMLLNSTTASSGMVMLESPTMFRAFQPVLASLQSLTADSLPFADVLASAKVESACSEPDFVTRYYASKQPGVDGESSTRKQLPFITHGLNLDHCQEQAFTNALHRKVYVCQGPPGTGKTLLGVLIAKQLLELDTLKGKPLLVLCYKNHALDEFLTKLLPEYGNCMVRVGGRSQDHRLDEVSLRELRNKTKVFRPVYGLLDELWDTWSKLQSCLEHVDKMFEIPAAAILTGCDYRQLYRILHGGLSIGNFTDAAYNSVHTFLTSVSPDELYKEVRSSVETYSVFAACVDNCLSNLRYGLASNKPQEHKIKLKQHNDGQKVKDEEDNDEEIREREEQLAMGPHDEGPCSGNEMRFDARIIMQSELFVDRSIGQLSHSDFVQRLFSRDPTQLEPTEQWLFHQVALNKVCSEAKENIKQLVEKILNIEAELEKVNIEADSKIFSQMRIIGMTITGASINKELLDAVKPAVVILEEAAEVSEPQLLACLGPHTEQLILIGDHKQLKPQTESYTLARDYHLDLSMMERLINNGIEFDQLELQNRMRPEFSRLLRDIYPNLRDNLTVVLRDLQPACLAKSMFFWTHSEPETQEPGHHGAINTEEANRCVRLAMFLIDQGCSPDRVTILCAYRRQTSLVRRIMREALSGQMQSSRLAKGESDAAMQVNVHTIDLYQGDENDVVIVSLVRSNPSNDIGFLKMRNRRCVAQSRARLAMVFVGNADCIHASKKGTEWRPLIDEMRQQSCLGPAISLRCPQHPETVFLATSVDEVPVRSAFCNQVCGHLMPCREHKCLQPCQPKHSLDHSICKETVTFEYPDCGHKVTRFCFLLKRPDGRQLPLQCQQKCERTLPLCGHRCIEICGVDCGIVKCPVKIKFTKSCGHEMERKCYQSEESVQCSKICGRKLEGCGHNCSQLCFKPCNPEKCKVCRMIKDAVSRATKLRTIQQVREAAKSELNVLDFHSIMKATRTTLDQVNDASEYLDVQDRVTKFVQPEHGWNARVTKIEKIYNPFLLKQYLEFKASEAVDPSRVEDKFHGTTASAVQTIINEGFKLPKTSGMYGAGIYFATDSSKSSQQKYTKGSNMLLLCSVIVGRSKTVTKATNEYKSHQQLKKEVFDSLFAPRDTKSLGGVLFDEYVVFDVRQALPKYIVHYDDLKTLPPISSRQLASSSGFVKISPSRFKSGDSAESAHLAWVQAEYNRVDGVIGRFGKITEVWVNRNPSLEDKFEAKRNEFVSKYSDNECSKFVYAFHGTSSANADAIFRENFRREKCVRELYGPGIYFSEFTDESQKYGDALLLCKLLLGKQVDHTARSGSDHDTIRVRQCASAVGDEHCQMLIIANPDQIMPMYRVFTDKYFKLKAP